MARLLSYAFQNIWPLGECLKLEESVRAVALNPFGGAEPQGYIPVARGTHVRIYVQDSLNTVSIVAFA